MSILLKIWICLEEQLNYIMKESKKKFFDWNNIYINLHYDFFSFVYLQIYKNDKKKGDNNL